MPYDYDIVSAFPSVARDLVDIRCLEWVHVKKVDDKYILLDKNDDPIDTPLDIANGYVKESVYGYVRCEVTIYDWVMVSPILKEDEDGRLISPVGMWETYLTKGELDFIDKWKIGEYKILEGWWAKQ